MAQLRVKLKAFKSTFPCRAYSQTALLRCAARKFAMSNTAPFAHTPSVRPSPDGHSLASFGDGIRVAIFGAGGGIGAEFVRQVSRMDGVSHVYAAMRTPRPVRETDTANAGAITRLPFDLEDEASIAAAAGAMMAQGDIHLCVVATGILQDLDRDIRPERSWKALDGAAMGRVFALNTTGPALVAKHMLAAMPRTGKSVFAALSARVGSIGDNGLGGWHAYRASKAALNQILRTLSIELARKRPEGICVGLHPGTVDTRLSEPFQGNVAEGKLFSPQTSVTHMLGVIDGLTPGDSGWSFAWDGQRIAP